MIESDQTTTKQFKTFTIFTNTNKQQTTTKKNEKRVKMVVKIRIQIRLDNSGHVGDNDDVE